MDTRHRSQGQSGPATVSDDYTSGVLPWLLAAKVQPPDVMQGYTRRNDLLERIEPLQRVTVLRAPGGFGKTSLLADIHQRARQSGRLAAWLTLDQDDGPGIIDVYLAYAFSQAGLTVDEAPGVAYEGGEQPTRRRTIRLAHAIERHGRPCLLVLDNVEKVTHRDALQSINFLLQHAPHNLSIALGMHENPGLDFAGTVLTGNGVYLTADQLRFAKPDIARFFNGMLSRRELNELEQRSEGWPVMLRAYQNTKVAKRGPRSATVQDLAADSGVVAEWLGEGLLQDLAAEDRRLLLDMALFDYINPALANEVLGTANVRGRVASLVVLDGLLHIDDSGGLRLNPILKEYCVGLGQREDPEHFREMQGRLARAEAQQGHVVQALRHARDAGDNTLLGELAEQAGGARIWARLGAKGIAAVDSFLNAEVVEAYPRAGLVRVVLLGQTSRLGEALALYGRLAAATSGFRKDRPGGDDRQLRDDNLLIQASMAGFSCRTLDAPEVEQMLASSERRADAEDAHPIVRGALNLLLGVVDQMRGDFDAAGRRGAASMDAFGSVGASYGRVFATLHLGSVAFAQGRADEALDHYGAAGPTVIADVMGLELRHEQTVSRLRQTTPDLSEIANLGWFDVYAAAYGLAAELAFEAGGAQAALLAVEDARVRSKDRGMVGLEKHLDALHIHWLLKDGLVAAAEQAWLDLGLPTETADLLDLRLLGWRRAEAVACARIHLHLCREEFDAARALADALCATAEVHGLRRMLMNGQALAMAAESLAGRSDEAVVQMARFLTLAEEANFVRPLARVREQALSVLPLLVDGATRRRRSTIAQLITALDARNEAPPTFTERELEVVRGVEQGLRNKEIANRLGITENGVRFHLKKVYSKTNTKSRDMVVQAVRMHEAAANDVPEN